jgi:hypothetical protein
VVLHFLVELALRAFPVDDGAQYDAKPVARGNGI